MQKTEAFASAVTVTVPILALAAGAEARAVRDRLRRPDEEWEKKFEAHQASHEFDPAWPRGSNRAGLLRPGYLLKTVTPKLAGKEGRGFVKVLLSEGASNGPRRRPRNEGPTRPPPVTASLRSPRKPLKCQILELTFEYEN